MKMGKSFSHRIKKSAHSAREVELVSLVVAGGNVAAAPQPPLQSQPIQYKRAHTSTLATSSTSAGPRNSLQPPKPPPSVSTMDTFHASQPSIKATSTSSPISQAGKKSEEGSRK